MDREKVIKGLEHCKKYGSLGGNDCNGHYEYTDNLQEIIKTNNHRKDCPYGKCKTGCVVTLVADTLALLKDQQEEIENLKQTRQSMMEGIMDRKDREVKMSDRADISEIETIKCKRRIVVKAIRCIACGAWECPEYDTDKYEAEIIGEAIGLCESCRKAIERAKERMEGR